jgi:hypothetical protein
MNDEDNDAITTLRGGVVTLKRYKYFPTDLGTLILTKVLEDKSRYPRLI